MANPAGLDTFLRLHAAVQCEVAKLEREQRITELLNAASVAVASLETVPPLSSSNSSSLTPSLSPPPPVMDAAPSEIDDPLASAVAETVSNWLAAQCAGGGDIHALTNGFTPCFARSAMEQRIDSLCEKLQRGKERVKGLLTRLADAEAEWQRYQRLLRETIRERGQLLECLSAFLHNASRRGGLCENDAFWTAMDACERQVFDALRSDNRFSAEQSSLQQSRVSFQLKKVLEVMRAQEEQHRWRASCRAKWANSL